MVSPSPVGCCRNIARQCRPQAIAAKVGPPSGSIAGRNASSLQLQAFICSTGLYYRVFKSHIIEHPLDRGALRIAAA
jgi:hypothetical protein